RLDLSRYRNVWIVGAGKASQALASAAYDTFRDRLAGGSIAVRDDDGSRRPGIVVWRAGHPEPNQASTSAAEDALRVARSCGPEDLLLCLLSGGASALWALPPRTVPLSDLKAVTAALLRSGAPIGEVNTVRKHLSGIAGDRLAGESRAAR